MKFRVPKSYEAGKIKAIYIFGLMTWLRCSWHWRKLATYADIAEWRMGN